jgi:hypothetical protein
LEATALPFSSIAESFECNHNPSPMPLIKASMRFASSEFLKIETAFPTEGQTAARTRHAGV